MTYKDFDTPDLRRMSARRDRVLFFDPREPRSARVEAEAWEHLRAESEAG